MTDHDRILIALEHIADAVDILSPVPNAAEPVADISTAALKLFILARVASRGNAEPQKPEGS